jgi:hypothetical protein
MRSTSCRLAMRLTALWLLTALGGCYTLRNGPTPKPNRPPAALTDKGWGLPDTIPGVYDYLIDARTGNPSGDTRLELVQPTRIILYDINPFLFQYRLSVNETRIAEASAREFINYAFNITLPDGSASKPPSTTEAAVAPGTTPAAAACAKAKAPLDVLAAELADTSSNIRRRLVAVRAEVRRLDQFYQSQLMDLLDAGRAAPDVRASALAADDSLWALDRVLADGAAALEPSVDEYQRRVGAFAAALDKATAELPACRDLTTTLAESRKQLVADTVRNRVALTSMAQNRARVAENIGTFRPIATDPQRFYLTYFLPAHRTPTNVTILVERRAVKLVGPPPPTQTGTAGAGSAETGKGGAETAAGGNGAASATAAPFDTIGRYALTFGARNHFVMTAGGSWADLAERQYTTLVQVRPLEGGFADTVTTIAYSKNSRGRVGPLITLSTRVVDLTESVRFVDGLHLMFGAGIAATRTIDPNLLAGGAVSFFDERVFLNGGVLVGQLTTVGGGLAVDGRLPRGITTVPTMTRLVARPGAALTFRIVPW